MARIVTVTLIVITILFSLTIQSAPAEAYDPDKTAEYMEDLAIRPDFPVNPTFAYYYVYTMKALGKKIDKEHVQKITAFLSQVQQKDGGFSGGTGAGERPSSLYSYYSLKTLSLLSSLHTVDTVRAAGFLTSLQNRDGGFGFQRGGASKLPTTYYSLAGLEVLNAQGSIDRRTAISYIMNKKVNGQGFSVYDGKPVTFKGTYWATASLSSLAALDDSLKSELINALKVSRYSGNATRKYVGYAKVKEASHTYQTLKILGRIDVVNEKQVMAFIEDLYVPQNGGFGPQPGFGSTPPSTYDAVAALVALNALADPESSVHGMASPYTVGWLKAIISVAIILLISVVFFSVLRRRTKGGPR